MNLNDSFKGEARMVSEDKMQEEIDKATVALGIQRELDLYSILILSLIHI